MRGHANAEIIKCLSLGTKMSHDFILRHSELVISKERNEWPSLAPNESWEKVSQSCWVRVCWGKFKIWAGKGEKLEAVRLADGPLPSSPELDSGDLGRT